GYSCLKGRTLNFSGFQMSDSPAFQAVVLYLPSFLRRSATCGYENNAFQAFHLIQPDKQFKN
ncbi:MAG: hypothetical protein LBT83_03105, partial [Tannerella sp.]|nr:hypothetical protein [Tannerella sp.]